MQGECANSGSTDSKDSASFHHPSASHSAECKSPAFPDLRQDHLSSASIVNDFQEITLDEFMEKIEALEFFVSRSQILACIDLI